MYFGLPNSNFGIATEWTNVDRETESFVANDNLEVENHPENILIENCRELLVTPGITLNISYP